MNSLQIWRRNELEAVLRAFAEMAPRTVEFSILSLHQWTIDHTIDAGRIEDGFRIWYLQGARRRLGHKPHQERYGGAVAKLRERQLFAENHSFSCVGAELGV